MAEWGQLKGPASNQCKKNSTWPSYVEPADVNFPLSRTCSTPFRGKSLMRPVLGKDNRGRHS